MNRDDCCGIYFVLALDQLTNRYWLPVESLSANATICLNSSRFILRQTFSNPKRTAIAVATYIFPVYKGAEIVGFTCKIGKRIIQGGVRENHVDMAHAEVKRPRRKPGPDVWSTEISNIPARCKVEVEITLVCELELKHIEFDVIRFALPTKLAPQPAPGYKNHSRSFEFHGGIPPDSTARAMQITIAVTMASPIKRMQSPSHPVKVAVGTHTPSKSLYQEEFDACKGYATLSQNDAALDRDFILDIISEGIDTDKPQAVLETHPTLPNSGALLLSLNPQFQMPRMIKPEVVFIADTSATVENRIPQLENALKVSLKSLPVGVKFNICWFDRDHRFLWPKGSRSYNQKNLDAALKYVETITADYEFEKPLMPPLEKALRNRCKDLETEIIVLTDGDFRSWNLKPVCELVSTNCKSGDVRVFALGIGDRASKYVNQLKNLARAGRGDTQIVRNEDKLDAKMVQILKAALGAHLKECNLEFPDSIAVTDREKSYGGNDGGLDSVECEELEEWEDSNSEFVQEDSDSDDQTGMITPMDGAATADDSGGERMKLDLQPPTRLQTPHQISPDFTTSRTNIYTILSGSEATPRSVIVKRTTTSGETVDLEIQVKDVGMGTTVHQLAAKRYMQELEERYGDLSSGKLGIAPRDKRKLMNWIEKEAVRVGTMFGVAGKWTSFVAVENVGEIEHQIYLIEELEETANDDKSESSASSMQNIFQIYSIANKTTPSPYPEENASAFRYVLLNISKLFQEVFRFARYIACCSTYEVLRTEEEEEGRNENEEQDIRLRSEELRPSASPGISFCEEGDDEATESTSESDGEEAETVDIDDDANKIYALMQRQAFNGSFPSGSGDWARKTSEKFKMWIQQGIDKGVAALQDVSTKGLERLLASAMAIALFQGELNDSQDVWEMMVEKTDAWGADKVGETAWNAVKIWVGQEMRKAKETNQCHWPWMTRRGTLEHTDQECHVPWSQMFSELYGPLKLE